MDAGKPPTPLHLRSSFSLLRGVFSPEELCDRAAGMGCTAAGITDINNFYGAVRFIRAAEMHGIKPVVGLEVESAGKHLFTALCRDREGFSRANRIVTALLEDPEYDPLSTLVEEGWDGLFLLSPHEDVISRLRRRDTKALYAALFYGVPFDGVLRWARSLGVSPVALNRGVYETAQDRRLYRLLRAIDENSTVDALPKTEILTKRHRIASPGEMAGFFSAAPEALQRAEELAGMCTGRLLPESYVFPRFDALDEEEAFHRLKSLCLAGVTRRYGAMRPDIRERIDYELSIIRDKGFSGYFLVVNDIVSRCPRTCGRGSSAASIVSYLLGITHVDPLEYNLFFERFLNRGRKDPPDIDVDFPWDEREKALAYVFEKYGGRAGMVADHVTFGPRSCLREPAKAFGIPGDEIARLLECARFGEIDKVPPYLWAAAKRLKGMPRHIGTHPGGVVITPGPITDYTHLQMSRTGFPVIAWEKDAAEDAGLVKIDILGNRSLGVLRDTIALVNPRRERGNEEPVEWEKFQPLKDGETRRLIEEGDTLGVFYVESPATRQLLKKMGTGDYSHLVIASSIIRPAANRYIRLFVSRLKGEPYKPLHPFVEEPLRETQGIMVYQEDVARVAIAVADFSPAEADSLRKVLSKKDRDVRLKSYRERFFEGGGEKEVGPEILGQLWEMILSFDGYSFCKAHSASYALLSYRLAWMKRFYPLEFFTSVLNNGGGFYSAQVYLNEVRRLGFPVLHPDINRSGWNHSVEGTALRLGLKQVRDTPEPFLRGILEERERGGPFGGYLDFLKRLEPSLSDLRNLIRCGGLDPVTGGMTRPELFWAYFHRQENSLFDFPPVPPLIGDYTPARKLYDEVDTLGLLVSCHPLQVYRRLQPSLGLIDSRQIVSRAGTTVRLAGVLITGKEVRTKKRKQMGFFSFDDPYGIFETVLFPGRYEELLRVLEQGGAFLISGKVEMEFDTPIIEIADAAPLVSVEKESREEEKIRTGPPGRGGPLVYHGFYNGFGR